MSDDKRVAVVTGGNRGMGYETCRQLAARGLIVVLTARDEDQGRAAVKTLADAGHSVDFFTLDVTDQQAARALAEHVEHKHGRVDVLVNNAGVVLDGGAGTLDIDPEVMRKTFEINSLGALNCCQALVPLMKRGGYGRIVNVSSGMGQLTDMGAGWPAYRVSKAALNAITKLLSVELSGSGIKVNAVCPGHVATDMGGKSAPRTIEEGVDTTMWLATLRDDGPTGGFFRDCKQIPW